jgi:hypothetical protein
MIINNLEQFLERDTVEIGGAGMTDAQMLALLRLGLREPAKKSRARRATNKTHIRRIALIYAAGSRAHKFRRVSDDFLAAVEANALNFIKDRIDRHPSKGVTLK